MTKKKNATVSIKKQSYKRKYGNQYSKFWTDEEIEKTADQMLDWFRQGAEDKNGEFKQKNIWLKDFAIDNLISANRITEFKQKNTYFKYIYDICMAMQESLLFKMGLDKSVNVAMPIICLKNNHGWTDKQEIETILPDKIVIKLPEDWK